MPTLAPVNDKEAKAAKKAEAAAALARARQWAQERSGKSPAKTTSPKRGKAKKKAAAVNAEVEAPPAAATTTGVVQYAKTPSREDRAKARANAAKARGKAREWSEQRKKQKTVRLEETVEEKEEEEVPAVIKTDEANKVEDLSVSDDFKTAAADEANILQMDPHDVKELSRLGGDLKNTLGRLQDVCSKYIVDDAMDCD